MIQRASVFAQLPMHRRTPLLARGPRGPTDSYFRTWAGFHSAPSLTIVSARHELALLVLKHWNPVDKWLYHVHRPAFHLNVYRARQRHFDLCLTLKQVASDAWDLMNVLDQPLHQVRLQSAVAFAFHKVTATHDAFNHTRVRVCQLT